MYLLVLDIRAVDGCQTLCSEEVGTHHPEQFGCVANAVPFFTEKSPSDIVFLFPLLHIPDKLIPLLRALVYLCVQFVAIGPYPFKQQFAYIFGDIFGRYLLFLLFFLCFLTFGLHHFLLILSHHVFNHVIFLRFKHTRSVLYLICFHRLITHKTLLFVGYFVIEIVNIRESSSQRQFTVEAVICSLHAILVCFEDREVVTLL